MSRECYRIGDLEIDVGATTVYRGGEELSLPPLSFRLLLILARFAPDVAGTERLIAEVWRGVAVSNETLTQRIALLRRALGEDGRRPTYIRAVRGSGYRLIPEVERVSEIRRHPSGRASPDRPKPAVRWLRHLAATAACVTVAGALGLAALGDSAGSRATTSRASAEELISRGSFYQSRHDARDNRLAIEIFQTALDRQPNHPDALVGLSLSLSQGVTKFNRPAQGTEAALSLAEQALRLVPSDAGAHRARAFALDSRGQISDALEAYRRSAALDPESGAALSSAAYLLYVQGHLAGALRSNLQAARHPDPGNYHEIQIGLTLAALGFEHEARVWLTRALELRPDNVFAAATLGRLELERGRIRQAKRIARDAISRGIVRPELHLTLGHAELLAGHRDTAATHYRAARAVNPRRGHGTARLLILERLNGTTPALEARYRRAVDGLRRDREEGDEWPECAVREALLHAAFGYEARALQALDQAIALGYRNVEWLRRDPMLESLRESPGFEERIAAIRQAIDAERQRVLSARWLPPELLRSRAHGTFS